MSSTPPQITRVILKSIQHKNKSYKQHRNKVTHLKEIATQDYFQKLISENKQNINQLWKTTHQIISNKTSKAINQTLKNICVDGKRIYDQQEISNSFHNYFINVGHSLTNKISCIINCSFTDTDTSLIVNNNSKSFFLRPISVDEILKHIIGTA